MEFGDVPDVLIFASGVSNSSEIESVAFQRERGLLDKALRSGLRLVYFSSCALSNPATHDTPYMSHKREMEEKVLATSSRNFVFRLPQVVGHTSNPHTLANYLTYRIQNGLPFSVWAKAERNLIDIDDIVCLGSNLIRDYGLRERTITLAAQRSMPMPEIVSLFERVLERKANCTLEDRGDPLLLDNALCLSVAAQIGIDLGESNAERIIRKYYGSS